MLKCCNHKMYELNSIKETNSYFFMNREELIERYNLRDEKQLDYEIKRSQKKNLSIEEWLDYKYDENREDIDFLKQYNDVDISEVLTNQKLREDILKDIYDSQFSSLFLEHDNLKTSKIDIDKTLLRFFEIEKHITNEKFFWFLFGIIYVCLTYSRRYNDELVKILKRREDNLSQEERLKYSVCGSTVSMTGTSELTTLKTDLIDELSKYNDDDDITIYRGFKVREGKKIKDENGKQLEGSGLSYSLNKELVIGHSVRGQFFWTIINTIQGNKSFFDSVIGNLKSNETICEGCGIEYEKFLQDENYQKLVEGTIIIECINKMSSRGTPDTLLQLVNISDVELIDLDRFLECKNYRDFQLNNHKTLIEFRERFNEDSQKYGKIWNTTIDTVSKSYFGEYIVKKKDILCGLNYSNEMEVICNSEDLHMKRYEVISLKDYEVHKNLVLEHS